MRRLLQLVAVEVVVEAEAVVVEVAEVEAGVTFPRIAAQLVCL
jgi:hypothetical protein